MPTLLGFFDTGLITSWTRNGKIWIRGGAISNNFCTLGFLPYGDYGMVYVIERHVTGINIMISTYILWTFIPLVGIYNNNYGIYNAPIGNGFLT
jgi:hypothetical protein